MKAQEAANILGMVEAAFPRGPWPEDTEAFWLTNLVSYEYDVAQEAVRRLVDSEQFTPAWATFVGAVGFVRSARRRDADIVRSSKALASAAPRSETWRTRLDELRAQLRAVDERPRAKRPANVDADGVLIDEVVGS